MWLLGTSNRALERRIEEVSDEVKHLARRFDKVQGELTTTLRHVRTNGAAATEPELLKRLAALEEWAEKQES